MSKPSLNITFSNNNLLQNIQNVDGNVGFIGTGYVPGNLGKVLIINNLIEAESQGITSANEPTAHKEIKEFYTELGGSQTIYLLLVPSTVTMAQMLDSTNPNFANKLINFGAGSISKLGVFKNPLPNYNGGTHFFDTDVPAAITASKSFCQAQNSIAKYFRIIIQGRIANESSTVVFKPNAYGNGFAGVVVGDTIRGKGACVGLTLARAVKFAAHIKIGKVANGALSANKIFIGTKELGENNGLTIAAVAETRATANLTITNKGTDGSYFWLYTNTSIGWIFLGEYTKVAADTTEVAVATAITANINSNTATSGFSATRNNTIITITAPVNSGDSINTLTLIPQTTNDIAFTNTAFTGGVTAKPEMAFSNDVFHDSGFISFVTYPGKAGFYFGVDNMCSQDDYRLLALGSVIDACAKIVTSVYTNEIEAEVDTTEAGTITEAAAVYLEEKIKQQVAVSMGERISGFIAVVDRTTNIINTSKTKVKMRVLPVGYNTYIEVDLGLTSGNSL